MQSPASATKQTTTTVTAAEMEGDRHGYSYATSLAVITDEIQNNVEDIQKEVQNEVQKPATINTVYMGERVSGKAPSSVPTVDKVMGKVWISWCCPGLLPGVRYMQCVFYT